MSTKMEYTGKDVTEAIKTACSQLKVPQDQLNIEVQSVGSCGIFGLCRRQAKVLVSLRTEAAPERVVAAGADHRRVIAEEAGTEEEETRDLTALMADVDRDLSQMLTLMGMPSQVDVSQEKNKVLVQITGEHSEEIIGQDGQILDNLQYLLRKMINKKHAEKVTISLNAGNYRETRSNDLEELARRLSREVRETGKTRSIPALNPAERRIVHLILQEDTTIRSRSVGDGLFKKILIYLPGKGRKRSPRTEKSTKTTS
jgi:spoIIIJ-associated protein